VVPTIAPVTSVNADTVPSPYGFPAGVRDAHFFNCPFAGPRIRRGRSLLADHPRLTSATTAPRGASGSDAVLEPDCIRAGEIDGQPRSAVYGAPRRLPLDNQLGYEIVGWIEPIEVIESLQQLGKGQGGRSV